MTGIELPVKRPREEESELGTNGLSVEEEKILPQGISAVIPGWFSEISPMWPGTMFSSFMLLIELPFSFP